MVSIRAFNLCKGDYDSPRGVVYTCMTCNYVGCWKGINCESDGDEYWKITKFLLI